MLTLHKWIEVSSGFRFYQISRNTAFQPDEAPEDVTEPDEGDSPLGDAARGEREYVRQRLREELKREPTELELDEWLRRHTEGY
jgi:hypothetical protein